MWCIVVLVKESSQFVSVAGIVEGSISLKAVLVD